MRRLTTSTIVRTMLRKEGGKTIALTDQNGAVFGKAALSIFESLILAMLEEDILDEELVKEMLDDASDAHRYGKSASSLTQDEFIVAAAIDRLSQSVLTVHRGAHPKTSSPSRGKMVPHVAREGDNYMSDNIYSVTELVGSSTKSIEDAIEQAVKRASKTIRNLDWFETKEIRGHIKDDEIIHYQVVLKLGFRYED